ncbi:hypothetical protein MRB53_000391 [Persea americana]|uniref:Uncharacterized protein n=1 Tax=Persea americana TaxID=3435 RepID=A0ACC2MPP8_PERAE|nr:hypothetical protein MRB53_000391 [Persea americana]
MAGNSKPKTYDGIERTTTHLVAGSHARAEAEEEEMASVGIEEFLMQCENSGDSAYNALKSLLKKLDDPTTRADARVFLSDLQKKFDS